MQVIGVTGGIGTGKSTVSQILKDLGAKLLDADCIARQVTRKGEKALEELVEYFGTEILREDGELDRKKVANIIFNNADALSVVNEITHKWVVNRILLELEEFRESGSAGVVVLDVPIPVKKGFLDVADEVWVVLSDREARIQRVMERSGLGRDEIMKRMDAQLKDEEYKRIANRIIMNNGSIEDLEKEVVKLFIEFKSKGGLSSENKKD